MKNYLLLISATFVMLLFASCGGDADRDYADAMKAEHATDTSAASAVIPEPAHPVLTQEVVYAVIDGDSVRGYLAYPAQADSLARSLGSVTGTVAGVIMIHEWWGLNDNIRASARRMAGDGFRVLAVDLYGGEAASTPDAAQALMKTAMGRQPKLNENMEAAYNYLTEEGGAERVAVMGWCFGGTQALEAALAMPEKLDATVIYYGRPVQDREHLATLDMPIIGFYGGEDEGIPVDGVREFESTLNDLGKNIEVHVYDEAGHAFANPSGNNYVEEAATDACRKTVAFLKKNLYPNS